VQELILQSLPILHSIFSAGFGADLGSWAVSDNIAAKNAIAKNPDIFFTLFCLVF